MRITINTFNIFRAVYVILILKNLLLKSVGNENYIEIYKSDISL